MDLKDYYGKIRKQMDELSGEYVVVVSKSTTDGGRAGVLTEVTKFVAAKMVVDERAQIATPEQTAEYYKELRAAHEEVKAEEDRGKAVIDLFSKAGFEALKKTFGLAE